jgi:DNA polymerase-1
VAGFGKQTLYALTGKGNLEGWTGTFLDLDGGRKAIFMPPLRQTLSQPWYKPVIATWLLRAWRLAIGQHEEWQWPKFIIEPGQPMLAELERLAETTAPVGFDTETTGLSVLEASVHCIGLTDHDGGVSVPWPPPDERYRELVRRVLESPHSIKVAHNAPFDLLVLGYDDPAALGIVEDTLPLHAVIAPQLPHDLGFAAALEFSLPRWKTTKVGYEDRLYNARDTYVTVRLHEALLARLARIPSGGQLYAQAKALLPLVLKMQKGGISVDDDRRSYHRKECEARLTQLGAAIGSLLAPIGTYKIGLNAQHGDLKKLFYDHFKIRPTAFSRETGQPVLNAKALQDIISTAEDPQAQLLARAILSYRRWYKLHSTYIVGLPTIQGKVHSSWKTYGTLTGRWSSAKPNMQNIPKARVEVRLDGSKVQVTPSLRDMFIAEPGCMLLAGDFSQLELRIMAQLAKAPKLLEWYSTNADVHQLNACALFGPKADKSQRNLAKKIAYAFNYNISKDVTTVWSSLVVDFPALRPAEVRALRKGWFKAHPEIATWQTAQIALANERDYVEEILTGRREYFFGRVDPNKVLNFPIQGFAGELTNRAILALFARLPPHMGRIVLQVHDEILCEVQAEHAQEVGRLMRACMEQTIEVDGVVMKYTVDLKIGQNWADMAEIVC